MSKHSNINIEIPLPANFQKTAFFAFHQRDQKALSEYTKEDYIAKGIIVQTYPAQLSFDFKTTAHNGCVMVNLALDGLLEKQYSEDLKPLAYKMLGILQPIDQFEARYQNDPEIGMLIAKNSGLRIPQSPTGFEAISWAIIGQLISVHAAVSIRRKLIQKVGIKHSKGLYCYPTAEHVLCLREEDLCHCGFSRAKAYTLLALSAQILQGELDLNIPINTTNVESFRKQLLEIKGIGPWTVNYALLRGFGYWDGTLEGDVAVRRNLQKYLGKTDKIDAAFTKSWLMRFTPYRALVAAHLWAQESVSGY